MFRVFSTRLISQKSNLFTRNLADSGSGKSNAPQPERPNISDVKGVTERVVQVPDYPVGFAGASKDKVYKNPEYFCYHVDSFAESMVELEKFRLPTPSNKKKN